MTIKLLNEIGRNDWDTPSQILFKNDSESVYRVTVQITRNTAVSTGWASISRSKLIQKNSYEPLEVEDIDIIMFDEMGPMSYRTIDLYVAPMTQLTANVSWGETPGGPGNTTFQIFGEEV